ncbi:hypothetical protein BYT27DRAFT_7154040 [Phlegmacium glaucopus]|nr:hypothetical protein BYT27DRAFT_7154040 [Phlegmacium glaucopus]
MLKSLALVSVLTSAAWAQLTTTNATSSATSSTVNPLIPTGITTPCTTFLNSLNSDASLTSCLTTLTNITSAFAPGSPTPSNEDVASTLVKLCNDTVAATCPDSLIRPKITSFYAACPAELTTNSDPNVVRIYDVLYSLLPLRTSVCSKDDSANWCVKGPSATTRELNEDANGSSVGISDIMALLYMKNDNGALRRRDQVAAIVPNLTTYHDANLPFAFFTPDLNATQLCVSCARQVLTAYINFESNTPYAPGLNNSLLLSTQSALFSAVQSKCPANFLSGVVKAAGGLSGTSSAIPTYGADYHHIIALVMGAVTLAVSVAL